MTTRKRLIVVGNGMVGQRFLETLVSNGGNKSFEIIVFGEEKYVAYDRVHLSELFTGKTQDELSLTTFSWFKEEGIQFHPSKFVISIDRKSKSVLLEDNEKAPYDILVLATGSSAFVPPVFDQNQQGIFVYRGIEDVQKIIAFGETRKTVAVIGGGLLGLEAAKAMKGLDLLTHVVEFAPRLMAMQLDDKGAEYLCKKIKDLGVQVHLNKNTQKVITDNQGFKFIFTDKTDLQVDMIVISAGIRPRDELAKEAGLEIGARGGITVNNQLETSDPDIFAIGECASANGMTYGLVAPGYRMAEAVANTLLGKRGFFTGADMSTKLKLMGVDVASFGENPTVSMPGHEVILENPQAGVYKKLILTKDGLRLDGGILVGDTRDYNRLQQMVQNETPLPKLIESLLFTPDSTEDSSTSVAFLPSTAVVCSCENVTKGDLVVAIREHKISNIQTLKKITKAGTGCGGCLPLMNDILQMEMEDMGVAASSNLCEHFPFLRKELFLKIRSKKIHTFKEAILTFGKGHGCEICKPTIASILASCWNEPILNQSSIQDTNDAYLGNIQKNGTYSVVPRIAGGELTPDQMIAIGQVAKEFNLYTKITGGQRIDLFGARIEDLPLIWEKLIDAGFETGQAYGKSLRTIKSCVGSNWCRYGVRDSTGLAIELENRYKGIRTPHKVKSGVSGCTRECAEAQSKDFGLIATDKGWNLYVCGNGGMKPQHAQLLASDLSKEEVIRYLDRFFMYYIRTADKLTRTSVWLNKMKGGIEFLRSVIIEDSLNLNEELEVEMKQLIDSYECEWAGVLKDKTKKSRFRTYLNSDEKDSSIRFDLERGQIKPTVIKIKKSA